MALTDDELATLQRLERQLADERPELERLAAYYEGVQRLERLGLAVPPALERFVVVVNWPRITSDSVEQRCDVEGFRLPHPRRGPDDPPPDGEDDESADDELWSIWQANDLDEQSQQGHLEALKLGRAYVCVGTRTDGDALDVPADVPLITVESPFEMTHEVDRRTRRVSAALRVVSAPDSPAGRPRVYLPDGTLWAGSGPADMATLYLPDVTIWCERVNGRWVEKGRDPHGVGWPLVVPLMNRPALGGARTQDVPGAPVRLGTSEMADVIPLTDAASRALTNAQVATEVMAIPQRHVAGVSQGDFVDPKTGKQLTAWETYFGAIWATASKDANFGQFEAAQLSNFETIVNHYANLASGASGLPTRFYGQYTTNPPSEGSIVADESRLIMNAYRKHRGFGGTWERVMRLVRRIIDREWNPDLARMETLWRNPETPTRAQTADAVVKLYGAKDENGVPLLPREAAWEEMGYSQTRIKQLKRMVEEERQARLDADPVVAGARAFELTPPGEAQPGPNPLPGDQPAPPAPARQPAAATP